jgi:hypothetical protein
MICFVCILTNEQVCDGCCPHEYDPAEMCECCPLRVETLSALNKIRT